MSMLDILNEALTSVNEALHELMLKYSVDKKIVYGVVEGKDDPIFYRSIIERFIPNDWRTELIQAGSKRKVIDTYNAINWEHYSRFHVAFFVDRDLSDITGEMAIEEFNVYVTDDYSIENYVVTESVAERMLIEACNVKNLTSDEMRNIISIFSWNLAEFQKLMVPIMAQILGWRKDNKRANINNLSLDKIFEFDEMKIAYDDTYSDEKSLLKCVSSCVGAAEYSNNDICALKDTFVKAGGPERFTRGKYLVWFFSKIIINIHKNIGSLSTLYNDPPKVRTDISPGVIMFQAAPRARIPDSLKSFIEKTFVAHIYGSCKKHSSQAL